MSDEVVSLFNSLLLSVPCAFLGPRSLFSLSLFLCHINCVLVLRKGLFSFLQSLFMFFDYLLPRVHLCLAFLFVQ